MDEEQIPRKPLFLNFDETAGQNVLAGYQSLFSGRGKLGQDAGNFRSVEAIMALATPRFAFTCPPTTARVIILSL